MWYPFLNFRVYHVGARILNYKGVRTNVLCYFEFYRTAILKNPKPFVVYWKVLIFVFSIYLIY